MKTIKVSHKSRNFMFTFPFVLRQSDHGIICPLVVMVMWFACLVLVIWLALCIVDRIKWNRHGYCKWEPSNNQEFMIIIALFSHHLPDFMLIFFYIRITSVISKRIKVRHNVQSSNKHLPAYMGRSFINKYEATGLVIDKLSESLQEVWNVCLTTSLMKK